MDCVVRAAVEVDSQSVCECFNDGFADYLISFPRFDAASWPVFLRRQGIDLGLSLIAVNHGRVIAFSLITPRAPGHWRISVMGARPEVRGTGPAARLLAEIVASAAERGVGTLELEVFYQNLRARRLYVSRGFEPVARLFGFVGGQRARADLHMVGDVSCFEASAWADEYEGVSTAPLPWQVCGEAIRRLPGSPVAWRCDNAQMVFSLVGDGVSVNSLLDQDPDWRGAVKLLETLKARYRETALRAPQLQAEHGAARAFRLAGWEQVELFQELMRWCR